MAKKKAPKKKKAASTSGGGFGAKAAAPPEDPAKLLRRAMDVFDTLERDYAVAQEAERVELEDNEEDEESLIEKPEIETDPLSKFAICIRSSATKELCDWVPVAMLGVTVGYGYDSNLKHYVPAAVAVLCREIAEAGTRAYPSLKKISRNTIEYSFEPLASFDKYVYEGLQGRNQRRIDAAATLGAEVDASPADIKRAHRKLMMELHPDRFAGDEEGAARASAQMLEVQAAYAELGGGVGGATGSWYEKLGGKSRVDFSGALDKAVLGTFCAERPEQSMPLNTGGWRAGLYPCDPTLTTEFIARNLQRED